MPRSRRGGSHDKLLGKNFLYRLGASGIQWFDGLGVFSSPPANPESASAWIQAWLACLAFYYPLLWLSTSLIWSTPDLTRVALLRDRLGSIELNPLGMGVSSLPPKGQSVFRRHPSHEELLFTLVLMLIVLLAAVLIVWLGRRQRTLGGMAIATLSSVALAFKLLDIIYIHQRAADAVLASVFYFAVLSFGLRRMLTGWPTGGRAISYAWRLGSLMLSFAVPPVLVALGFSLFRRFGWWTLALLVTAPSTVAAILVSFSPPRQPTTWQSGGWKSVWVGVALSIALALGVLWGSAALQRDRLAATKKVLAAYPAIDPNLPYSKLFFQRGVNFTVEGPGGYASDEGREMLEGFPQYGINAVALVPYGFTRRGSSPEIALGSLESDEVMTAGARVAHARGIKVMLKPAIWEAFKLQFSSAGERAEWFEQYQKYLEHYARLAKEVHADIFCVGGEFTHLSQYDSEWRRLIARVRELYPGPLVYAANFGEEFESLKFWDALDYIGLQEYYPLPDDLSTDSVVHKVEAVQRKFQKHVIFTEVGFASMEGANRRPWDDSQHGKISLELQASCYDAVFRTFYPKPWFEGMYWWKVGTDGEGGPDDGSLTPWGKPAMEVVKRWYTRPGR